ncbi:MAG: glycosyltransferase [Candidatus Baldrarchaeia archaeon]
MLELIALGLAGIHFGFPLLYYWYVKNKWLHRPWNIKKDKNHKPKITVIVPTYNEAELIEMRLDNIVMQDYPKNKLEVIVVDSASIDETAEIVERWISRNSINIRLLREPERKGKLHALNIALRHVDSDAKIVIFTDADAYWEPKALSRAVSYFADPKVGAVTGNIFYEGGGTLGEDVYRGYYNTLRVAESKIHSTPVHNGPLIAIRASLLRKMGLPNFPGSDDSAFGSLLAFAGYRAIQVDDLIVKEPARNQARRKLRRAQHLLLNFLKTKRYAKERGFYTKSQFERIWKVEWWLHVVNPWFLLISVIFLVISAIRNSIVALVLLGVGLTLSIIKTYRIWILQQLYLLIGALRNLRSKEVVWSK